ncbi:MAG: YbjN domain-containing protein [Anaerolineaceae bacterium 4572_78]|nr:MAG: YbjN domain-containing protein [Anaerolineaceae bacterium 4572_78]
MYQGGFEPEDDNSNGLEAFATLNQFLEQDGWRPQIIEGRYAYRTYYSGKNGELQCYAQIRVDLEQFLFYAVAMVKTPEGKRHAVAEYTTRANYGLRIGNFEVDYSDGEVRYKGSLDFEGEKLSFSLIRNVIYPSVQTMDRYLTGLLGVMYGSKTAEEAIGEVEGE